MYPKIPVLYTAGMCSPPDPWYIDNRIHANRIYYISEGSGRFVIDKTEYSFQKGHLYFIPASDSFEAIQDAKPIFHTFFDFEMCPPIRTCEPIDFKLYAGNDLVDNYFCAAESLLKRVTVSSRVIMPNAGKTGLSSPFHELIIPTVENLLAVICAEAGVSFVDDPVVLNALTVMHREISGQVSVNSLAADAFMRTDCFIRRFRNSMGITPYSYLRNLRLRTAANLRNNGMSVKEISQKVGYGSGGSLSHALTKNI
jgi:Transcriptional regulator containing an amidase domain and an AraC-type DNA-binding HTH domain